MEGLISIHMLISTISSPNHTSLIRLQRIYNFWCIHAMFIIFLYDLVRTNPDWRSFQQNYHGVVSCAEIKVLGMCWKSTEISFGKYKKYWNKKLTEGSPMGPTRVEGAPTPLGRALRPCGPLVDSPDLFSTPTPLIYPQTSKTEPRSGVSPLQASVATKNQSGPCSGTQPEGKIITGGHLHHPGGLHDEEGVVHPRGWAYVPVPICLISLLCSWFGIILMYHEICYYSWTIWCFFLSNFLWWIESCSLRFHYVGLSIGFENTWCMSCDGISVVTMGCFIDLFDVCFGT